MRLRKPSKRLIFVALILLAIFLLILPRQWLALPRGVLISITAPVQKQAHKGSYYLVRLWNNLSAWHELAEENRALRQRVTALENALIRMKSDLIQAEEKVKSLDALSKLPAEGEFVGVSANIIAVDSSNWRSSIMVDRGASHGVEPGQAVVWHDAVVGVVQEVTATASRVLLLVDPQCRIAAYDVRSREHGIIEGTGDGFCRMKYISREKDVRSGDLIVTSGVAGNFPPSLLVGQVIESRVPESGMFRQIRVQPRVQFSQLESVLILQKTESRAASGVQKSKRRK